MFAAKNTAAPSGEAVYIESVFSTYLYTGDGSGFSVNNGIDLSGKGGMVWLKDRTSANIHELFDTNRGAAYFLRSNGTDAQSQNSNTLSAFNNNGFSIGDAAAINTSTNKYASWTFREQAKFFDVVTYTGTGSAQTINHNLGSVPGCIIIKCFSSAADWAVYHRGLTNAATTGIYLNSTDAAFSVGSAWWNSTAPTSTQFSVGTSGNTNNNGATYVAYLFAHDAGGFGATGTDNVISCGFYLGSNHRAQEVVQLGYEPQWVLIKNVTTAQQWVLVDNMRGMAQTGSQAWLAPNTSAAETTTTADRVTATSTGFFFSGPQAPINQAGSTFIYIAIRRGPMKTPTSGTSVFSPVARTGTSAAATMTAGFAPDAVFLSNRDRAYTNSNPFYDKLRGNNAILSSNNTGAEQNLSGSITQYTNTGITLGSDAFGNINGSGGTYINWIFQRAPGFFDVVCYTGTGSATTQTHNLGVAPELLIVKSRDTAVNWVVWASAPTPQQNQYALNLNTAGAWGSGGDKNWGATLTGAPNMTSTTFSLGDYVGVNGSAKTYVAYLFASCPGVSKVGSYTGTGTTLQVDCGFTAGARFVMIKRTDSTGDWYVWDSARGIVAGNDPYLLLNSTAAEVTNTDYIDPLNAGFEISSTAPAAINANGGTFIFLAIA